ncbi:MAG: transglycosylase SLT domain-containing protein [Gammaproteobacteria bacterium]
MTEDRTVIMPPGAVSPQPGAHGEPAGSHRPIEVRYVAGPGRAESRRFERAFVVGREADCDVSLPVSGVSRRHLEVYPSGSAWFARDLDSANGSYIDGQLFNATVLNGERRLRLGWDGPELVLSCPPATPAPTVPGPQPPPLVPLPAGRDAAARAGAGEAGPNMRDIVRRYLSDRPLEEASDRTLMIRSAVTQLKRRQSRRYMAALGVVGALLIAALSIVIYQQWKLASVRDLAIDLFYDMKTIELQIGELERVVARTADETQRRRLAAKREELRAMSEHYRGFIAQTALFGTDVSTEDAAILRMARIFGECELNMPDEFADEVKRYIAKWQRSKRLQNGLERLHRNGYLPTILRALDEQNLQPQFVYLALQESNFDVRVVGPPTRYGHAKGMWQFIPSTATRYGLQVGPLSTTGRYDPADERFDFEKATHAAARYLRDIYETDAQASGLLVMASYNWGEHRVIKRLQSMPANPRERNFWKVLEQGAIPDQTYDYVFYIFAAAVIGQNPALFGFDFENPLERGG